MRPGKTDILSQPRPAEFRVRVFRDLPDARDDWCAMQAHGVGGPHDCHEWANEWWQCVGRQRGVEPVIISGCDTQGELRFLLPLGLRRGKGVTVLEWLASAHGNYASGLLHPELWRLTGGRPGPALIEAIRPHLPPADLIHLEAVPASIGNWQGPLAGLATTKDASSGYAFSVTGGGSDYFQTHLSKKARGNLRRGERRLGELGKLCFHQAAGAGDIRRALKGMFEQKRAWCRQSGVTDFLASPDIRKFYESLLLQRPGDETCRALLFTLELDGEILATNLGMRFRDTFYGIISTITQGEYRCHSPGNVLFRKMVEDVANRGITVIDWGAGENGLKSVWCNIERERHHVVIPLTVRGVAAAFVLRAMLRAKAAIKSSPRLWELTGRIRKLKSESAAFADASGPGLRGRLVARRNEA